MAVAVYGAWSTGGAGAIFKGPYYATSTVLDISLLVTGTTYYVVGFVDGEQRAKFFYSSQGAGQAGAVALPTLALPNALPNGAVQINTNSYVYGVTYSGYIPPWGTGTAATQGGLLYFGVSYAAGNPDGGSPAQFSMDPYGLLFVDTSTTEYYL
jgi:hypothetical protein